MHAFISKHTLCSILKHAPTAAGNLACPTGTVTYCRSWLAKGSGLPLRRTAPFFWDWDWDSKIKTEAGGSLPHDDLVVKGIDGRQEGRCFKGHCKKEGERERRSRLGRNGSPAWSGPPEHRMSLGSYLSPYIFRFSNRCRSSFMNGSSPAKSITFRSNLLLAASCLRGYARGESSLKLMR